MLCFSARVVDLRTKWLPLNHSVCWIVGLCVRFSIVRNSPKWEIDLACNHKIQRWVRRPRRQRRPRPSQYTTTKEQLSMQTTTQQPTSHYSTAPLFISVLLRVNNTTAFKSSSCRRDRYTFDRLGRPRRCHLYRPTHFRFYRFDELHSLNQSSCLIEGVRLK